MYIVQFKRYVEQHVINHLHRKSQLLSGNKKKFYFTYPVLSFLFKNRYYNRNTSWFNNILIEIKSNENLHRERKTKP